MRQSKLLLFKYQISCVFKSQDEIKIGEKKDHSRPGIEKSVEEVNGFKNLKMVLQRTFCILRGLFESQGIT